MVPHYFNAAICGLPLKIKVGDKSADTDKEEKTAKSKMKPNKSGAAKEKKKGKEEEDNEHDDEQQPMKKPSRKRQKKGDFQDIFKDFAGKDDDDDEEEDQLGDEQPPKGKKKHSRGGSGTPKTRKSSKDHGLSTNES